MRVKICGITNLEDARLAVSLGADALGFVFYPPSVRAMSPEAVWCIVKQLPPFVTTVGVFVNQELDAIASVMQATHLDVAQLHFGSFYDTPLPETPFGVLPVLRARGATDLDAYVSGYCLIDAWVQGYGGKGKVLDLSWFVGRDCSRFILAGGLRGSDLAQLKALGCYGVDVSSGVESAPGRKDPKKLEAFLRLAKS